MFFENYPSDKIPKLGTYGEKWREKTLMHQMPKQDISKEFCKFLKGDLSEKRYNYFVKERNDKALDIGICFKNKYDHIVIAILRKNFKRILKFHFVNFIKKCRYCQESIEPDTIYVHSSAVNNDLPHKKLSSPEENKIIDSNNWHSACFRCSVCDELLVDLVYCMKNNNLFCVRHYAETIKPRCMGCDEVS